VEKRCLEPVNFRLKNKETKLTPHFWREKAKILQEKLSALIMAPSGSGQNTKPLTREYVPTRRVCVVVAPDT
jgi:hypothetical protein